VLLGTDAAVTWNATWHRLAHARRGSQGLLTNHVLTIVEQALWDLTGHLHQTSVWKLLGRLRERVSAFGSTMCGDDLAGGLETPEDYGLSAVELVAAGYQVVKLHTWMPPIAGAPNVARGI
jgi:L-alanine-DL-glutamate epimerase-like enolase superfamily enzyme